MGDTEFWQKWYDADELQRVELVKTLTLPSTKLKGDDFKRSCAVVINSYLTDLENYLQERYDDDNRPDLN
jgi:hypothetical protein